MRAIIVGVAEVEIVPDTAGFAAALDAESDAAFGGLKKDAKAAGEDAGAGLRGGVRDGVAKLEGDLSEAGLASGAALRGGLKDGSHGIEDDLAQVGVAAGGNLRAGVKGETGKLGEDMEKDGERGGERLSKGVGTGLSKLAGLVSNTGLPIGGLSSKLDAAGKSMQDADHKSSGLGDSLDKLGGYALLGVGAGAIVAGAATVKMAEGMETADTKMASAEGQGAKFGKTVGDAFLSTGGKAEYSGKEMATAFAGVAGQMKATEGHALSAGESLKFMTAAGDLTTATQGNLASVTATVSKVMQAFQMHTSEAAHASDVLYSASNLTGVSVESLGQELSKVRGKLGDTAGSVGQLSALLVDMKEQGISGRGAMTGLSTGMNALLKMSNGVATAVQAENAAYGAMSPAMKTLVNQYKSGAISAEQFKTQVSALPASQQALVKELEKSSEAAASAQLKFKSMGLTVFDAQGKFVGMGSIIDQLAPRFAKMNKEQQLVTATTLFSAGAARQMTAAIDAGIPGYQKASAEVEKHGATQRAAAAQSKTLHDEEKALGVMFDNVAVIIGQALIPIVTKMVSTFVTASTFVLAHKAILIGLAAVITGVLGTAIAVFTVNKMVAFGESFTKASGVVKTFASDVEASVAKVIAQFTAQEVATDKLAATTAAKSEQMELDFEGTGTAATAAEGEVSGAVAGEATAVTTADSTIEADNVAAGASFMALLGPIGLATAAAIGLNEALPSGDKIENLLGGNQPGESGREGEANLKKFGQGAAASGSKSAIEGEIFSDLQKANIPQTISYGIIKALGAESGLKTTATGGEGAYGLAQWLGPRRKGLEQYAGATHQSGNSVEAQIGYLIKELQTSEHGTYDKLKGAKSAQQAEEIFVKEFERPDKGNIPSILERGKGYAGGIGSSKDHGQHSDALNKDTAALGSHAVALGESSKAAKDGTKAKAAKPEKLFTPHGGSTGFFEAPGTNYTKGKEEELAARLDELGKSLGKRLTGVSGYRSPAHSVAVGGFPDDPHTRGEASDTEGTQTISEAVLRKFGLTRPFPGAKEADHMQILPGTKPLEAGGKKVEAGGEELKKVAAALERITKSEQKKVADDTKTGQKTLNTVLAAEHSTSLKTLNADLEKAHKEGVGNMVKGVHGIHQQGMGSIEKKLDGDHNKALAKMSAEIVSVHKKAMEHEASLVAKAAKEAWEKSIPGKVAAWEQGNREQRELEAAEAASPEGKADAAAKAQEAKEAQEKLAAEESLKAQEKAEQEKIDAINRQAAIEMDIASNKAQEIGDATKVMLDKQAEVGLSGTAEIAAHLQTVADEVAAEEDKQIGAAKLAQDETAGKGAVAEAEAAARTSKIEAEAKVKEAEAQKALELAKATANSAAGNAGAGINIESLVINGAGMSSSELMGELGWSLTTGSLPIAQPAPVAP